MKKRLFSGFVPVMLFVAMLSVAACKSNQLFKSGTYTGKGQGMGGALTVEVKLTDSEIESFSEAE